MSPYESPPHICVPITHQCFTENWCPHHSSEFPTNWCLLQSALTNLCAYQHLPAHFCYPHHSHHPPNCVPFSAIKPPKLCPLQCHPCQAVSPSEQLTPQQNCVPRIPMPHICFFPISLSVLYHCTVCLRCRSSAPPSLGCCPAVTQARCMQNYSAKGHQCKQRGGSW